MKPIYGNLRIKYDRSLFIILALCFCALSGCATVAGDGDKNKQGANVDPFEKLNRATSHFNEKFDENLFQPVARAYVKVLPKFVQTGVGNFFGNINDVWTAANSFLQGNAQDGFNDVLRFSLNSTFGLLGLLDIASEANIPKHHNDFGQTLGVWGVPNGPYLIIPFLGPSVVRDAASLPIDYYADLWSYYRPVSVRNTGTVVRLVDKRAAYLDSYSLLENAALDKYIFIRDAYLQRIASQIDTRKNFRENRAEDAEIQKSEDKNAANELAPAMQSEEKLPETP